MNNIVNELLKEIIESTRVVKEERDPQHASYEQKGRPIRYVQPRILQTWGDPNGIDTPVLKRIAERMEGATTIAERIEKLNQFMAATLSKEEGGQLTYQEGPAMGGQVGTKIATIMYLEVFYALVTQFEAAPAGFLLESILAGSFGGQAITDVEGGSLPITDIIIKTAVNRSKKDPTGDGDYSGETYEPVEGNVHYSLKLLTAKGLVKGSYTNLVKAFFPEDRNREPLKELVYLVVEKTNMSEEGMDLVFHEFKITRENWFDWIGPPKGLEEGKPKEEYVEMTKPIVFNFDPKSPPLYGAPEGFPENWAIPAAGPVFAVKGEGFAKPGNSAMRKQMEDAPNSEIINVTDKVWQLNKNAKDLRGIKITSVAAKKPTIDGVLNLEVPLNDKIHEMEAFINFFDTYGDGGGGEVEPIDLQEIVKIKGTKAGDEETTTYLFAGNHDYGTKFLTGETHIKRSETFKKIYTGSTGKSELKFQEALKLLKLKDGESFESYINRKGYANDPGFGAFLKAVPGFTEKGAEKGGKQFAITSAYHKGTGSEIGTLSLQAPKLREVAEHYAEDLGETIKLIYNCLDDLTNDIQNYFLKEEDLEFKRQQYGGGAIKASQCVIDNMTKQIGGEGAGGDEAAPSSPRRPRSTAPSAQRLGESKKPINLDKLIEQMINKKFN